MVLKLILLLKAPFVNLMLLHTGIEPVEHVKDVQCGLVRMTFLSSAGLNEGPLH